MKRILSSLIMLVFIVGTSTCFAAYPAAEKVTGAVKDIISSPLLVTDNVKTEMHSAKFMPFGIVGGAAKGTFYMGKQVLDGAWTIVSTPYHMVK